MLLKNMYSVTKAVDFKWDKTVLKITAYSAHFAIFFLGGGHKNSIKIFWGCS